MEGREREGEAGERDGGVPLVSLRVGVECNNSNRKCFVLVARIGRAAKAWGAAQDTTGGSLVVRTPAVHTKC